MTKKPTDYTPLILRMEGLSEPGKAVVEPQPTTFVDDLGGANTVLPMVQPKVVQERIARDHREIAREEQRNTKAEQLSMLVRLGLSNEPDPIPPPPPKPRLRHNQRLIKLGNKEFIQTVVNPIPPWRRT